MFFSATHIISGNVACLSPVRFVTREAGSSNWNMRLPNNSTVSQEFENLGMLDAKTEGRLNVIFSPQFSWSAG